MTIRVKIGLDGTAVEYDPMEDSWLDEDDQLKINPDEILVEVRKVDGGTYMDFWMTIEELVKEAGYL